MIAERQAQEESFKALLEKLYGDITEESEAVQKIRAKGWEHFLELGVPNRHLEAFRYLSLKNLFARTYSLATPSEVTFDAISSYIYPECKESVLVYVNGYYSPKLSQTKALSKKVVISSLKEATRTYGAFLTNHWAKTIKDEADSFVALNAAMHGEALFIYLPPNTVGEPPIQILNVVDTKDKQTLITPRLQLFSGKGSEITLYNSLAVLSGDSNLVNQVADFLVEDDSHIVYNQVALDYQPTTWVFDAVRATLKRNCTFKSVNINTGAFSYRNDYRTVLTGENSDVELDGVWMLREKCESHSHVLMDHQAPHCKSRQLFKGVLAGSSRSSFEGKIYVRQAAQKTDAFQRNNNLLLSDMSHADSKPNLEIFADDVKASHGATVGRLDQEQLFYMKSRGFTDADAKRLLVNGYCKDVIDRIALPSLSETLQNVLENAFFIG
jgi:Fe-S cluster assembly protein SufD